MKNARIILRAVSFALGCILLVAETASAGAKPRTTRATRRFSRANRVAPRRRFVGPRVSRFVKTDRKLGLEPKPEPEPTVAVAEAGKPDNGNESNINPQMEDLIGEWLFDDRHRFELPPGAEEGLLFPTPEELDLSKIPGHFGPDRRGPSGRTDPAGAALYAIRQSESDISCFPGEWDAATMAKVGRWGGDAAPPYRWCYRRDDLGERIGRKGSGKDGGTDGGTGGGTGGGNDNSGTGNDNGGAGDNDNVGNDDPEVADNDNGSKPDAERDSNPEGDDPDEFKSPVSQELFRSLAGLLSELFVFDPSLFEMASGGEGGGRQQPDGQRNEWEDIA